MRREILLAYVTVLGRTDELLQVCAATTGDAKELQLAVEAAFGLSPLAAHAVVALQVQRFTPGALKQIRQELADVERHVADAESA